MHTPPQHFPAKPFIQSYCIKPCTTYSVLLLTPSPLVLLHQYLKMRQFLLNCVFFSTLLLLSISITPTSLVYSLRPHKQLQKNQHFQILDVSASIQKTLQVFSSEKSQKPTTTPTSTSTSSSSVLSFSLRPLDSLVKPNYQTYSDITISRLQADLARANLIYSKLQLIPSKSTNLFEPEDLEAVPITPGRGGYAALVGVGQPAKQFHLLADTGSDINWLQCQPCRPCINQADPIFNPSESSSYKPLPCDSQQCNSLRYRNCSSNNMCIYGSPYGDQSFSIGIFATETLSFGSSGSVDNVAIGCGRINQGGFGGFSGILGLGGSVIGLPSQVKATSFSYCLVDIDSSSSSTLEFNSTPPDDSIIISRIKNPIIDIYYYVELTGIEIGGDQISIPESVFKIGSDGKGGIIVDSGTTVTLLETQVYNSVRDTFIKYTQNLPLTSGFQTLDTCYDLSSVSNVSLPKMSFQFSGSKTVSLPPENYFIPVTSSGKFCLAFTRSNQPVSIIGNTQQKRFRVNYDLAKNLIGFSPNKC